MSEFLSLFSCISELCVEYQSCHKFCDLGAHQFSALFNYCTKGYGPNTTARPAGKKRTEKPKQNFSTLLIAKLALVMNTKNVEEQIIFRAFIRVER